MESKTKSKSKSKSMPHVHAHATYVRPNKLQGNCVTCRNFHSTLSNVIKSCWTCCNINLTFYCI
ncbi:uncharacterized protein LOC108153944 [Drosophila miranda]|uniref:uncharacterized protein LOC108153944 n=1 Tax=Drosophila miranda TaxID=7229 RepID=UPI00143F49A8|nr:uncharacterized protein LOC108153944 [Drosophila miranda]